MFFTSFPPSIKPYFINFCVMCLCIGYVMCYFVISSLDIKSTIAEIQLEYDRTKSRLKEFESDIPKV